MIIDLSRNYLLFTLKTAETFFKLEVEPDFGISVNLLMIHKGKLVLKRLLHRLASHRF